MPPRATTVSDDLRTEDDDVVTFEYEGGQGSRSGHEAVLRGDVHPALPFVDDVRVVVDVGAGCGAATVLFARRYPSARVHALEPDAEARTHLTRNVATHDGVRVHAVGTGPALGIWTVDEGVERVDILKVDADGHEESVLAGLATLLPAVQVVYLEYASRGARRAQSRLLSDTHELYLSLAFLDHGRSIYLRRDLADHPAAARRLLELFVASAHESR